MATGFLAKVSGAGSRQAGRWERGYRFGTLPLLHDQIEVVADHDDGVPL